MTKTDRKIMMLMRMLKRANKNLRQSEVANEFQKNVITNQAQRIANLVDRIKGGGGAKAPVPSELTLCYEQTMAYVVKNNIPDGRIVSWYKFPDKVDVNATARGNTVIDWKVTRIDEGLYDLEVHQEWVI
jgi:hypothetical protein